MSPSMRLPSSAFGPTAALLIFVCASSLTFYFRGREPAPRLIPTTPRRCPVPVERPDFGLRCLELADAARLGLQAGDRISDGAPLARMAPGRLLTAGIALDLNQATIDELQALPDIGPALAARMVAARRAAPFRSRRELLRVPGIGPERLRGLLPFLRPLPD